MLLTGDQHSSPDGNLFDRKVKSVGSAENKMQHDEVYFWGSFVVQMEVSELLDRLLHNES